MGKLEPAQEQRVKGMIDSFFQAYDKDKSGFLDEAEMKSLVSEVFMDLNYCAPAEKEKKITAFYTDLMAKCDKNKDKKVSRDELTNAIISYLSFHV